MLIAPPGHNLRRAALRNSGQDAAGFDAIVLETVGGDAVDQPQQRFAAEVQHAERSAQSLDGMVVVNRNGSQVRFAARALLQLRSHPGEVGDFPGGQRGAGAGARRERPGRGC